jgi:hypothetical protein
MNAIHNLVDTNTDEFLKTNVELTDGELEILNYAYALNGSSKRYYAVKDTESNYFNFIQPI